MNQLTIFDYTNLDPETRIVVQQRTSEIKSLMHRTAQDIIDIGQKLIDVKARLGHGNFQEWARKEFDWSYETAARFMRVSDQFKNVNLTDLSVAPSALYLLAAPSTPEDAREEAITRAAAGEPITHTEAKEIVAAHKSGPIEPASDAPLHEWLIDKSYAVNRDLGKGPRQIMDDPLPNIETVLDKYPGFKPTNGASLNKYWNSFYADCAIITPQPRRPNRSARRTAT